MDLVWRFADGGVCDGVIISFLNISLAFLFFYFYFQFLFSEGGGVGWVGVNYLPYGEVGFLEIDILLILPSSPEALLSPPHIPLSSSTVSAHASA